MRGKKAKSLSHRKNEILERRRGASYIKTNEKVVGCATGELDMHGNPVLINISTHTAIATKNALYKRHKNGVGHV